MAIVPSSTRFIGFSEIANLAERKTDYLNSISQPFTMADIAAVTPTIDIVLDNGFFLPNTIVSAVTRTQYPFPDGLSNIILYNFWEIRIAADTYGITIPDESYFISISNDSSINYLNYLSIPNLINCLSELLFINNPNLTTINIGQIGKVKKLTNISFLNCSLSEESVNYILALLVSLDGDNGTSYWNSQVNLNDGTNAAPTGQGLIDKQTLIDRGATVETN